MLHCHLVQWNCQKYFSLPPPLFSGNARALFWGGTCLLQRGTYPLPKLGLYEANKPVYCSAEPTRFPSLAYIKPMNLSTAARNLPASQAWPIRSQGTRLQPRVTDPPAKRGLYDAKEPVYCIAEPTRFPSLAYTKPRNPAANKATGSTPPITRAILELSLNGEEKSFQLFHF
jgi:hypothetical protein